jgi:hypothetical protein
VLRETTSRGLCGLGCPSRTLSSFAFPLVPRRRSAPTPFGAGKGVCVCVCVCLLLQDLVQSCLHWGGGGYGRTYATRDDEPRPVWTRLPITH